MEFSRIVSRSRQHALQLVVEGLSFNDHPFRQLTIMFRLTIFVANL